ncbi:cyclase family protein [Gordonia sp. KTR9]|uniref:cyclase family protein n=1 Tax=Gordonia sp. KTR9 TaxID=337191 RepID=UPI0005CA93B5|nr:cyclase family protein [Gordonia sp. KTR9]
MSALDVAAERAELAEVARRVSNWGRWGEDDERGLLNTITPAKRVEAAQSVVHGIVHSLAVPLGAGGPQVPDAPAPPSTNGAWRPPQNRSNPVHTMLATGSDPQEVNGLGGGAHFTDDVIYMHLQAATQWDALSHCYYDDQLYNGKPASSVTSAGARYLSIDKVADGFLSRGVLLDIARLHGVETLPGDHVIDGDDLEAAADAAGVAVTPGDIVIIRTGLLSEWALTGSWAAIKRRPQPGVGISAVEWVAERDVAAIATDNTAAEALGTGKALKGPVHMLALRDMGLHLGEYWFLEDLAADCARLEQSTFMLSAAPLPFENAVGSPTNPIALL